VERLEKGFTIKACTVRKRQDGWYVSVRIEDSTIAEYTPKDIGDNPKVLGIDLGLTKLVHLSDGYQVDHPSFSTNKKAKRTLKKRLILNIPVKNAGTAVMLKNRTEKMKSSSVFNVAITNTPISVRQRRSEIEP